MPEDMTPKPKVKVPSEENIEQCLFELPEEMQDDYVQALRQVVKGPSVGGYGQYLGSLTPLVFATRADKLEALHVLNRWNEDSSNK